MKNIFTVVLISLLLFVFGSIQAKIIEVSISNYKFTPADFTANVGDTVRWTYNGSGGIPHTTTSTSIAPGASSWNSGTLSNSGETYLYPILIAGNYGYLCDFHGTDHNMKGTFTVNDFGAFITPVSLIKQKLNFPNPFTDKVMISYNQPGTLIMFDILGNKVFQLEMEEAHRDAELNLSDLYPGVYFISLLNEGRVVETRKVIKDR